MDLRLIDTFGTLHVTWKWLILMFLCSVCWFLFEKYLENCFKSLFSIQQSFSFFRIILWLTVSNASNKCINTPKVYLFLYKESYILILSSIRAWSALNPNRLSNSILFLARFLWSLSYLIVSGIFERFFQI